MASPTLSPEALAKLVEGGFLSADTAKLALGKAATDPELARRDREMAARMTPEQAKKIMPMQQFFTPSPEDSSAPAPKASAPKAPAPPPKDKETARTRRIMDALEQGYAGSQPGQGTAAIPRDWKIPDHVKGGRLIMGLNTSKLQPGDLDAPPVWPAPPKQPDRYDQMIGQIVGGRP
jgi:hypothetical protein